MAAETAALLRAPRDDLAHLADRFADDKVSTGAQPGTRQIGPGFARAVGTGAGAELERRGEAPE